MKTSHSTIEPLEARIAPATFVVSTLVDTTNASHTSGSLRDAIINAHSSFGDTIVFEHVVGGKTVPLTGTIKMVSSLPPITDGVTILGPVAGSAKGITINLNKLGDMYIGATSGDVGLKDLTISNGQAEFGGGIYILDGSRTITITGCAITGNHAVAKAGQGALGGGIFDESSSLTITNSKITGNSAVGGNGTAASHNGAYAEGGGIYLNSQHLTTITNSVISGNIAKGGNGAAGFGGSGGLAEGGGLLVNSTTVNISHSFISGNTATSGNGASGATGTVGMAGAAGVNGGTGGTGKTGGNGGLVKGGGIYCYNSNFTITNSTVSGNSLHSGSAGAGGIGGKGGAGGSGVGKPHAGAGGNGGAGGVGGVRELALGGGIAADCENSNYAFTVQASTISGNTESIGKPGAGGAGGAAGAGSYKTGNVVHKGIAGGAGATGAVDDSYGGGVWAGSDSAILTTTLSQVTIANNSAEYGGGCSFTGDTANIHNCTIAGNKASGGGGGVYVSFGTVNVISTIIAGNTSPTEADVVGHINDATNDLIGIVTANTSFGTDTNNLKGSLAIPRNPLLGKLALHDGGSNATMLLSFLSPALGKGSNPDNLTTDANGNPRVLGSGIDIGAVEEG